jgi:hypothetical protein
MSMKIGLRLTYFALLIFWISFVSGQGEAAGTLSYNNISQVKEFDSLPLDGTAFEDANANGIRDYGEASLSGWKIRLILDGLEIFTTTTNEPNVYHFDGLQPGKYEVIEEVREGWNQTTPNGPYSVALTDMAAHHPDFGNVQILQAISPDIDHPILHPTPEQARRWIEQMPRSTPSLSEPEDRGPAGCGSWSFFTAFWAICNTLPPSAIRGVAATAGLGQELE